MAGLLNIGLTGINAAQGQLLTTSHNIANAGVDGYHRQRVIQSSQAPYYLGGTGFFGNGTKMTAVTRSYDQFLENQVLSAGTKRSEYATYSQFVSQIDNLLADVTAGLTPALNEFFAGMQEVAANPTNIPARQALLSSTEALVSRFHVLDSRLTELREGAEYDIHATVDQINSLAKSIADLNQRIVVAQVAGPGVPANDLLDQRWDLVSQLNELISVSAREQADGSLSVFVGSGQSLVQSNKASTLTTVPAINDGLRSEIALLPPTGDPIRLPERLLTGGQLGGLLTFRSESLDGAQNRLGMIAVAIASAVNNQHKLGIDLDGALGQNLFNLSSPRIIPSDAAVVSFNFDTGDSLDDIDGLGLLTDADYELSYDGTDYVLTNLTTRASKTLSNPTDTFEGLSIDLTGSTLVAGQKALIQPTRYAARDIALAINDPRQIAAGNPVISQIPTTNVGNATLSGIKMSDVSGVTSSAWNASLSFAANTITVGGGFTPATLAYDPATESAGKEFTLTGPGGFEFTFKISGTPQNGDTFNLVPTDASIADSRNANLLGALQTGKLLFSGATGQPSATINMAYSQLVNKVGNKTHEVQTNEATQTMLLAQMKEARDALSAVNLDEEAANLVRYQQAYQASGQVMSVAQRLFDELISIVR